MHLMPKSIVTALIASLVLATASRASVITDGRSPALTEFAPGGQQAGADISPPQATAHWQDRTIAQLSNATIIADIGLASQDSAPGIAPGVQSPAPVPEPATQALLAAGLIAVLYTSRRRAQTR